MTGPGPPPLESDLEHELATVLAREREDGHDIHRDVRRLLARDGGAWHLVGILPGGREAIWELAAYIGRGVVRSEISSDGAREQEVLSLGAGALDEAVGTVEGLAWLHPDYRSRVGQPR